MTPVPEKKIFKGFLPYMGLAAILVMRPASFHQIFISLYLKAFIKNVVQIGKVVSEKIWFEFLYVLGLSVLEKKIFKGFYHIWAWRPSWSFDPDTANKSLFPLPKEAPDKIWL